LRRRLADRRFPDGLGNRIARDPWRDVRPLPIAASLEVWRLVHRASSFPFSDDGSLRMAAPRGPEAAPKNFRIFTETNFQDGGDAGGKPAGRVFLRAL